MQIQPCATLKGHTNWIYDAAFSPDGQTLATGGWDQTIRLWNVASAKQRAVLRGHQTEVFAVAFSPDGAMLASCSANNDSVVDDTDLPLDAGLHQCGLRGFGRTGAHSNRNKIVPSGLQPEVAH